METEKQVALNGFAAEPYFLFTAVCYDVRCDLVWFGQHLRSLQQVILHCTCSLPTKLKHLLFHFPSCQLQREREKARGDSCSAEVELEEQWWLLDSSVRENPLLSTDLSWGFFFFPFLCTECLGTFILHRICQLCFCFNVYKAFCGPV